MKKKFAIGLIVLLISVSFVFFGCDSGTNGSTGGDGESAFELTSGQSGLTLEFTQDSDSGEYTLTLTGTVPAADVTNSGWTDIWGVKPDSISGGFAAVSIDFNAVFTAENVAKILAIRNESQALRYYTGYDGSTVGDIGLLASEPSAPIKKDTVLRPTIYIPSDTGTPVRWVAYDENVLSEGENMTVLIWANASSKTSKLEITSWTDFSTDETPVAQTKIDDIATVIVDYSGITIE